MENWVNWPHSSKQKKVSDMFFLETMHFCIIKKITSNLHLFEKEGKNICVTSYIWDFLMMRRNMFLLPVPSYGWLQIYMWAGKPPVSQCTGGTFKKKVSTYGNTITKGKKSLKLK